MRRKRRVAEFFLAEEKPLLLRAAVPLTGLLLCLHLVSDDPIARTTGQGNRAVEELGLKSSRDFEVCWNPPPSRAILFQVPFYQEVVENKHLATYSQVVFFPDCAIGLTYIEFRDRTDAAWAKDVLNTRKDLPPMTEFHAFGRFVVRCQGTGEGIEDRFLAIQKLLETNAARCAREIGETDGGVERWG